MQNPGQPRVELREAQGGVVRYRKEYRCDAADVGAERRCALVRGGEAHRGGGSAGHGVDVGLRRVQIDGQADGGHAGFRGLLCLFSSVSGRSSHFRRPFWWWRRRRHQRAGAAWPTRGLRHHTLSIQPSQKHQRGNAATTCTKGACFIHLHTNCCQPLETRAG